jgi:hypothetical protein
MKVSKVDKLRKYKKPVEKDRISLSLLRTTGDGRNKNKFRLKKEGGFNQQGACYNSLC